MPKGKLIKTSDKEELKRMAIAHAYKYIQNLTERNAFIEGAYWAIKHFV